MPPPSRCSSPGEPAADRQETAAPPGPLAGFTIAVTAARRAEELGGLLERRGAQVVLAPALRITPLTDDTALHAVTRAVIADPPDIVVATTGIGFRGWIEAAEGWGEAEQLRAALGHATLLSRGPKASGAIRAAGLRERWSPESESSAEVLHYLLASGDLSGRRIAVQLHGEPLHDFTDALRTAGADIVPVSVYRWTEPADCAPLDRLIDVLAADTVDAVCFTSALAAIGLLRRAEKAGRTDAVVGAMRDRVLAACVGPVTAAPLLERGIPASWPERYRIGALVRHLTDALGDSALELTAAGHQLQVRGSAVIIDGALQPVPPGPMAVLRALAHRPGVVVPRRALLAALPGRSSDEHAVEAAVARLRSCIGVPSVVETVMKRGYRLATAR